MRCSAKSRRRICGTLSVRRLPRGNFSRRPQKFCGTFLSAGYFLPGRAKNMKPVKAFASCTARCASYGAAVPHILRHCCKMLHKSASRLCRKVYRRLQTITDQGMKKICPFLSVSVRICPYAKHNDCFCQNPFFSG